MRKIELRVTPFGVIALENEKFIDFSAFGDDLEESVRGYRRLIEEGFIDKKLVSFIKKKLAKGKVYTPSLILANALRKAGIDVELMKEYEPLEIEELLVKGGVFSDIKEAKKGIKDALSLLSVQKIKEAMEEKDKVIINAIGAYDEYTELINILYERLREWYGLHFPELEKIVRKYTTYARIVSNIKKKSELDMDKLIKIGLSEKTAKMVLNAARTSMGVALNDEDVEQIRKQAEFLLQAIATREELERYINDVLIEYSPNLTKLIGPKLAAKLIAKAGGLRKLATLPASTIQLLGAEKALFRSLKRGTKPPKHGLIFQHQAINRAPKKLRGKIARALAAKIAIAARVDVFGGEDIGDKLKQDFENKVEEIYEKYSKRRGGRKR
ncbi:C/D box methylation guide ribonucleoprotein complex aNOP56 subunit [Candidatus Geothermarchaeota archaeon]|nr:MAG: C/D box methylation guide ribonucleoprotein complex aNOP56 subunit [Candidatus Geothermarchaeota archaeon]